MVFTQENGWTVSVLLAEHFTSGPTIYWCWDCSQACSLKFVPMAISFQQKHFVGLVKKPPIKTFFQCDLIRLFHVMQKAAYSKLPGTVRRWSVAHGDCSLQSDRSCPPTASEKEPTPASAFWSRGKLMCHGEISTSSARSDQKNYPLTTGHFKQPLKPWLFIWSMSLISISTWIFHQQKDINRIYLYIYV